MVGSLLEGCYPTELIAGGLGEIAELGAFAEADHRGAVQVDLHSSVGGVEGALERPGRLLGNAHSVWGSQPSSTSISGSTVSMSLQGTGGSLLAVSAGGNPRWPREVSG